MKANEAPEKIYMTPSFGEPDNVLLASFSKSHLDFHRDIEYIRKDAFIEKACEYFRRVLEDVKVIDDYRNIAVRGIQASYTSVEEFIEDFRNYMQGE